MPVLFGETNEDVAHVDPGSRHEVKLRALGWKSLDEIPAARLKEVTPEWADVPKGSRTAKLREIERALRFPPPPEPEPEPDISPADALIQQVEVLR